MFKKSYFLSSSLIILVLLLGNSANAMDEEEKKHFAPRKDDKVKYPLSNPSLKITGNTMEVHTLNMKILIILMLSMSIILKI
ncbi:hypothetical protein Bealeia1_01926 [Candidatus Bealeia paramacronuclearis]|uniref:Uncharacterized protein n=1 Tax=Candidatus Bealeia paramacronuclearis TaxID=1921001 RepID=A0ABZ2C9E3_9PROT